MEVVIPLQFLLGVLLTAAFNLSLYGMYKLGQRTKRPKLKEDEEAQRKAQRMRQGFEDMMSYDVTKAVSGRKVT